MLVPRPAVILCPIGWPTPSSETLSFQFVPTFAKATMISPPGLPSTKACLRELITSSVTIRPESDDIHGFDERVNLESMRKITQATALFIAEWCGLQKA